MHRVWGRKGGKQAEGRGDSGGHRGKEGRGQGWEGFLGWGPEGLRGLEVRAEACRSPRAMLTDSGQEREIRRLSHQSWLWKPQGHRRYCGRGPDPGEGAPEKQPKQQRTGRFEEVGSLWWELRVGDPGKQN